MKENGGLSPTSLTTCLIVNCNTTSLALPGRLENLPKSPGINRYIDDNLSRSAFHWTNVSVQEKSPKVIRVQSA